MPAKRPSHAETIRKTTGGHFLTLTEPAKRTEPSKHVANQKDGFKYSDSVSTDIRKRFAIVRRQLIKAQRVADDAQAQLDLDAGAKVLPFKTASNA